MNSDPQWSSLGKPDGWYEKQVKANIVQYRDPKEDGLDSDIVGTFSSNDNASRELQSGSPSKSWTHPYA